MCTITIFPRIVSVNTIDFSCSPYSNAKQGRMLKLWYMLTAPMELSSPLFSPHPCLDQQRNRYKSLFHYQVSSQELNQQ